MGVNLKFYPFRCLEAEEALNQGKIDLILGKIKTPQDTNKFDFCDRAIQMDNVIFVRSEQSAITCLKDMRGRTVIVEKDFATPELVNDLKESKLLQVENQFTALELLESRKADAFISSSQQVTRYIVQKEGFKNIKQVGVPIESVPYGIAVRKGNTVLLSQLNAAFDYPQKRRI